MGLIGGKGGFVQRTVNKLVGNNYRDIYFSHNPNGPYKCAICGKLLNRGSSSDNKVTIDHIVPQSLGGTNNICNLQVLCQSCNSQKKAKVNVSTVKYCGQAVEREIKNKLK